MSERLDVAVDAARAAGSIILEHLRRGAVIGHKEPHNLVSDADLAAEDLIVKTIAAAFPGDAFLAEEAHRDSVDSPALWVIDPLDGTNNFAHGFPCFCTSIAFALRGEFVLGAVYDPVGDELFVAERGAGAFLNGRRVSVSDAPALQHALVATGFYYDRGRLLKRTLEAVYALFQAGIHGIRRTGSAALDLCYLGCGRLDGFFEYRLNPWDFGAGAVFIREAGGAATDSHGVDLTVCSADVTCSNGHFHEALLEIVADYRP